MWFWYLGCVVHHWNKFLEQLSPSGVVLLRMDSKDSNAFLILNLAVAYLKIVCASSCDFLVNKWARLRLVKARVSRADRAMRILEACVLRKRPSCFKCWFHKCALGIAVANSHSDWDFFTSRSTASDTGGGLGKSCSISFGLLNFLHGLLEGGVTAMLLVIDVALSFRRLLVLSS